MVHEKALLMAEVAALRVENQHQKLKRTRKKGYIQQGFDERERRPGQHSETYGEGTTKG